MGNNLELYRTGDAHGAGIGIVEGCGNERLTIAWHLEYMATKWKHPVTNPRREDAKASTCHHVVEPVATIIHTHNAHRSSQNVCCETGTPTILRAHKFSTSKCRCCMSRWEGVARAANGSWLTHRIFHALRECYDREVCYCSHCDTLTKGVLRAHAHKIKGEV